MTTKDALVAARLPQLQNLIKRDPAAYRDEFELQFRHFESELEIFRLRPTKESERFTDLITFISHTASCYPELSREVPSKLLDLVEANGSILHADVRAKLLQALMLFRSKGMIDALVLIKLAFRLMSIPDKSLRMTLKEYTIQDIKAINRDKQNEKLNRRVQAFLFTIVSEDETVTSRKTVDILGELYRRRIWTDARTVNVIGSACCNKAVRVMVAAINFFLGIETKMEDDDEEEKVAEVTEINFHEHSKKTKKRARLIKKQIDRNLKLKREKENKGVDAVPLFPAIQLLRDPQELAEKLFSKLKQTGLRFEVKLLMMNFISRLIGCHYLHLFSFYSFLQRYLTSHQQDVTQILAYLVQACHSSVPPEELLPTIKAIAFNFVTDRCSNEVIAVGINSIREILVRVPSILLEDDMSDFIQDIAMYGKKTHKSVMIAAHGVINFVREQHPALLHKNLRGKYHDLGTVPSKFGEVFASTSVAGVELLDAYERGIIALDDDGELIESTPEEKKRKREADADSENEWVSMSDDGSVEEIVEGEYDGIDDDLNEEGQEEWEDGEDSMDDQSDSEDSVTVKKSVEPLDRQRVLTSDDFELIERLRSAYARRLRDPRGRKLSTIVGAGDLKNASGNAASAADDEADGGTYFTVTAESLAPQAKTKKASKIDRMARILEGRALNKFDPSGHAGGLTNKEKMRQKNYVMVRKGKKEVANKSRVSNSTVRWQNSHRKEQFGRDKRKRRRT